MRLSTLVLGLAVLAVPGLIVLEPWHDCGRHRAWTTISLKRGFCRGGERSGPSSLKTLASAQADFRSNDRDGNGVADFWRKDVAGLYVLRHEGTGERLKLIELSVALADDRIPDEALALGPRTPKGGYWFRAIRHADEGDRLDPGSRFAYCCFPADYPKSGRKTFILDERNTIFMRDLGRPGGIEVFPTDEELQAQWSKPH